MMEPLYKYYVVQVETAFVANDYCEQQLTHDEEEAYAFTSLENAEACAREVAGIAVAREVSEQQLADLDDTLDADYLQQFCVSLAEL